MSLNKPPSIPNLSTSRAGPSLPSLPEYPAMYQLFTKPDLQQIHDRELMDMAMATCQEAARLANDEIEHKNRLLLMKTEKDQLKKELNDKLPPLTKQEAQNRRRSIEENVYINLLQDGYYETFQEIFHLINKQAEDRLKGGPDSILWHRAQLTQQPNKLDMMARLLKEAEDAARLGDFSDVYISHFALAKFFQAPDDVWLADHFFENCLTYSSLISTDEGMRTAEARCQVGLSAERQGDLDRAIENFTDYYRLAYGHTWPSSSGLSMQADACSQLTRVYSILANQCQEKGNMIASLEYNEKAFKFATESEDTNLISEMTYQLGMAFENAGDLQIALKHLHNYLESCQAADDKEGMSKAYEAIALSYQAEGKTDEAITAFQEYTKVAEMTNNDKALAKASLRLGALHNCIGNYLQSAGYFIKAFSVSQSEGSDRVLINASRVQYGISVAHRMLSRYIRHFDKDALGYWERLLDWKECKKNDFDKPLPDKAPEVRREVKRVQQYRQETEERLKEKKTAASVSTKKPRRSSVYVKRPTEQTQL